MLIETVEVKAGLNIAKMAPGDVFEDWVIPGFHIGISIDFPFNNFLSLETGILYNKKGAIDTRSGTRGLIVRKTELYYLDFPVPQGQPVNHYHKFQSRLQ